MVASSLKPPMMPVRYVAIYLHLAMPRTKSPHLTFFRTDKTFTVFFGWMPPSPPREPDRSPSRTCADPTPFTFGSFTSGEHAPDSCDEFEVDYSQDVDTSCITSSSVANCESVERQGSHELKAHSVSNPCPFPDERTGVIPTVSALPDTSATTRLFGRSEVAHSTPCCIHYILHSSS